MFKWLQMQQRYERRLRRIPALYKTTLLLLLSIQTYFLYCYAIFISEDITRQRGGVTFGTPCT